LAGIISTHPGPVSIKTQTTMKRYVAERLWHIARERALAAGLLFSLEVCQLMESMISEAVEVMEREGKLDDPKAQFEAKLDFMRFLDMLVEEAVRSGRPGEGLEIVKEDFFAARDRFGSPWPFV